MTSEDFATDTKESQVISVNGDNLKSHHRCHPCQDLTTINALLTWYQFTFVTLGKGMERKRLRKVSKCRGSGQIEYALACIGRLLHSCMRQGNSCLTGWKCGQSSKRCNRLSIAFSQYGHWGLTSPKYFLASLVNCSPQL